MLKINWDAAIGKNCGRIGLGVIARDCWGQVVIAQCITKKIVAGHSVTVETLAGIQGMLLVQVVNSGNPCNTIFEHLVEEIREGMADFSDSSFNFIT